ncbi:hypothetical protein Tco_0217254 [Tanacetum coccineum]
MAREADLKKQRVFNTGNEATKPVWNNTNRVNRANHFVPRPVQLNSVRPNVNTGRVNVNSVKSNVNSVRHNVNSVRTNVNTVRIPNVRKTARMTYSHAVKGNGGTAVKTSAGSSTQEHGGQRMASLKYCDKHNQVGFLKKPEESAGFAEIVDFLKGSHIRYALTHNPTIYDSLVKQFWQTATASTLADRTLELRTTIDTLEYTITEASVRSKLQLADALGISMFPNTKIFKGIGNMGFLEMKRSFREVPRPLLPAMLPIVDQSARPADQAEDQPSSSKPLPLTSLNQQLCT